MPGGIENMNGMQNLPYNSRGIPSQISTSGRYVGGQKIPKYCENSLRMLP